MTGKEKSFVVDESEKISLSVVSLVSWAKTEKKRYVITGWIA